MTAAFWTPLLSRSSTCSLLLFLLVVGIVLSQLLGVWTENSADDKRLLSYLSFSQQPCACAYIIRISRDTLFSHQQNIIFSDCSLGEKQTTTSSITVVLGQR